MAISHVLRGEEWISSTPKHILLYQAFGWTPPSFAHLPLLLRTDRSKLSKRMNDLFVSSLADRGLLPSAVVNFVAMLGWAPTDGRELFLTTHELAQAFDERHIHRAAAVVDMEKLLWVQRSHMRALESATAGPATAALLTRLSPNVDREYAQNVLLTCRGTYETLNDVAAASYFFSDEFLSSQEYAAGLASVSACVHVCVCARVCRCV
jgi:nondiscriminating glutamyl-tRNA synthetase